MSSSSSPSPPPILLKLKEKKKKKVNTKEKVKEKQKSKVLVSAPVEIPARNEGVEPTWAYQPPKGMVVLDTSQVDEDFDWDYLEDDEDKELWIIRVPEGFRTKNLDGLELPQTSNQSGGKLSTFERKHSKYDVWSAESTKVAKDSTKGEDEQVMRGEEVNHLTCLLPRKKKGGELFIAPKDVSRHIVITHVPAVANVDNSATPVPSTRHSVPKQLLKHRFLPYGALSPADGIPRQTDVMDVDSSNDISEKAQGTGDTLPPASESGLTPKKKQKHSQSPEKTTKKRKTGDSETPAHKSKKLKV